MIHSFEVNYDKKLQSLNFKTVGMHQYLNVISAEQYRRYTGEKLNIESDEAISIGTNLDSKVNIAGKDFKIKRMNLKIFLPIFLQYLTNTLLSSRMKRRLKNSQKKQTRKAIIKGCNSI